MSLYEGPTHQKPESLLPIVTVIVPAYNAAATIAACIESLLDQRYPSDALRVIVVDNNSEDGTADIIRRYPVTLAFEMEIQTSYAARNRGIALAHGEIVAFLDSDCVADRNWLHNLVQPFADQDVGVVGGKRASQQPDENAALVELFLAQVLTHDDRLYDESEPYGFPTANVAYRTSALHKVGIFDAQMPGGGDVDLAWRVQIYGGYRGVFVPEAIVYHKHHASLSGHFRQFRRYGFNDMVLTTLYREQAFERRTPVYQLVVIARQTRAIATYGLSFTIRLFRWRRWRANRLYLASPVFLSVMESGSLIGKFEGLIRTRFLRRNPYSTNKQEVKRSYQGDSGITR